MSRTDVQDVNESVQDMNPVMAPAAGLILYLGAVVLNLAAETGEPSEQNLTDWVVTLAIAGVGVGIAIWASHRAMTRSSESMARTRQRTFVPSTRAGPAHFFQGPSLAGKGFGFQLSFSE